jgi:pilus assembly protein CpaC
MADKKAAATKRPCLPTLAALRIHSALVLILVLTFAGWCCNHSIDAGEKDDQKPPTPQPPATPWRTAAQVLRGPDLFFESDKPTAKRDSAGGLKDAAQSSDANAAAGKALNAEEIARNEQLRELRKQEQQLLAIFGEEHPQVVAVRRQMALLQGDRTVQAQAPAKSGGAKPSPSTAPVVLVSQETKPAPPAQQPAGGPIITLPLPRVAEALQVPMPPQVENSVSPLGSAPRPTAKELAELAKYVKGFGDPTNTIDLIVGRSRLMLLKSTPRQIQIADQTIVTSAVFAAEQVTLFGKTVGITVLNLVFPSVEDKNKDAVLSYLVRVFPDPEEKKRLEAKYKALELEINRTFHDSVIHLQLVGDKVVVTGQAHDIHDATQILKIIVANTPSAAAGAVGKSGGKDVPAEAVQNMPRPEQPNAAGGATPGQENYLSSGNPNVINMIRIPGVQQVKLKVVVAEVNRTAARSIGLNFSIANNQGIQVVQNQTGSLVTPFGFGANGLSSTLGGVANTGLSGVSPLANIPVALSNGQVILAINALKSMHYAKSLAEPSLTASNGHTATFLAGGQFPVPVVTGNTLNGLQGVQFVPYGVQLNFTPFITDKDRIRLNVSASVSVRDTTTGATIGTTAVPGLTARNFTSTIDLREGQTLAVAGLLQTNVGTDRDQLPFLGEIPFINRLTGFDRTSAGEQELVVLITPELVQPMKKGSEIPRLPGSDLFEPSDLEFYLLGRLEGRRKTDFRSPVMTDFHRIQQYNRCEQTYIFGPSGYASPAQLAK